jgi:tRNA threonylcarbamoyladenosine biosynthesis protein TsaE
VNISNFISHSEEETKKIASDLATSLSGNEKICLQGPLGAGKTTFVKGFVEAFQIQPGDVMSPTFTLVREYGKEKKIYHVDLYRLENEEQIFEAGIYEMLSGDDLVIIEWADRLKRYYPQACIQVSFSHRDSATRIIDVKR